MKIGVLALQGAFLEHRKKLRQLDVENFEIRQKKDLKQPMDGLILPGGESTVMGRLMKDLDMYDEIYGMIRKGIPVYGTCAGMILLAKDLGTEQAHLGTMDIRVKRNAYGRQLGSFYTESDFADETQVPMTFIRAPYIETAGDDVEILARVDGHIVAARQENQLVTSFHPELDDDLRVHDYFLHMI